MDWGDVFGTVAFLLFGLAMIAAISWSEHEEVELYRECIRLHSPDACKEIRP